MNVQIRKVPVLLRQKEGILIRCLYGGSFFPLNKKTDLFKTYRCCHGQELVSCTCCNLGRPSLSRPVHNCGSVTRLKLNALSSSNTIASFITDKNYKSNPKKNFSTASGLPSHQEIGMPSLSPTMSEGNIVKWLKKEGEKVSPGDVLCEIETDKATVDMECMEEGYLAKIVCGDGAKEIKVGDVIAVTVEEEEDVERFKDYEPKTSSESKSVKSSASPEPIQDAPPEPIRTPEPEVVKPTPAPSSEAGTILCSPLARKCADDNKVPISDIKGSGIDGLIVKADIDNYLAISQKDSRKAPSKGTAPLFDYGDFSHSDIRKTTASRVLLSKQKIPHYYLTVDTCIDELIGLKNKLNDFQTSPMEMQISTDDLIIKAAALALRCVPQCNSSWTDDYIRQYKDVNINVELHTNMGLYTPILRNVDTKGLSEIAKQLYSLNHKAENGSLNQEEYEGGTFTVSNLGGSFRVKQFSAVIRPGQSGILAVGSVEKRVIPGDASTEFNIASFVTSTLSCDHRLIDGAIGAKWLEAFKGFVENPVSMLL